MIRRKGVEIIVSGNNGRTFMFRLLATTNSSVLREDPFERNGLAKKMPEKAKKLHAELVAWVKNMDAPVPTKSNPKFEPTIYQNASK